MLLPVGFFTILLLFFICKVLQSDIEDSKAVFISIFTILIGIGISLLVINGEDNFSFYTRCISFIFISYGFCSGIQYITKKNK